MSRHVFAIMAHSHFELTAKLIRALDHPSAQVVLHLDIPSERRAETLRHHPVLADVPSVERVKGQWGSFSIVRMQLNALKAALEHSPDYIHVISGQDLPLKPVAEIIEFFDLHSGKEFVHVNPAEKARAMMRRVKLYHSATLLRSRTLPGFKGQALEGCRKMALGIQELGRVDRTRKWDRDPYFGSQWVSISSALAEYYVENEAWGEKFLAKTHCPDETYFATLFRSSPFADRVYIPDEAQSVNLRHIRWPKLNDGHPHVWTSSDLAELLSSSDLFARKFDPTVDAEVIGAIIDATT